MRFRRIVAALAVAGLLAGCSDQTTSPAVDGPEFAARGPLVHHVSVGGADVCVGIGLRPGCDANSSLVANQYADGSVTGQWHDTFVWGGVVDMIHVTVDCVHVVGTEAWVSGVVKGVGRPVIMRVADNGASGDQISMVDLDTYGGCTAAPTAGPALLLYDMTGQVTVW